MRDSCGSSRTGETPQAFTPRRLTARPAESEHLEGKSTTPHYLVNSNKVCENSLNKKDCRQKEFYLNVKQRCWERVLGMELTGKYKTVNKLH